MAKKQAGKKLAFKDRKTGLVIFGIIHLLIGASCALSVLLMIFAIIIVTVFGRSSDLPMSIGLLIPVVISYLLLAIWFIWLGIGSILARRWARALILISSWLWFICGAIGLIFNLLFMPDIYDYKYIVMGFLLVIIPAAFVLFYSSKHVKATCEQRDHQVRWTDKTPLPVITLSSILGGTAISMPLSALYRWTISFFGLVLSGIPGAVVVLIYFVLFAYAAWGTYKLRITAWWCGFLSNIALGVSMVTTFSRVNLLELGEKMGIPKEHLEIIQEFDMFQNPIHLIFLGLMFIGFLGFTLYTKRYFRASP